MFYINILVMTEIYKHCEYCNKGIKHQSNWIRHTKTKKHLKNIKENTKRTQSNPKVTQSNPKVTQSNPKSPVLVQFSPVLVQSGPVLNKKFYGNCRYCEKGFRYKQGLSRHQKHVCKKRPAPQIINNTINKNGDNNCNNTNNTININIQGEEDLKGIIDDEMYYKLGGMEGLKILELYMKEVFINKEENKNIKYSNTRSNKCRVYKGDERWSLAKIDKIINDRIKKSPINLNVMIDEHLKTYDKEQRKIENETRKKIYDSLFKITRLVYKDEKKYLLEKSKISKKDKENYKELVEDHKMALYN
jgi:hypothetical protein